METLFLSKRAVPSLCIKWTALRLTSERREQAPRCFQCSYWRMSHWANEIAHRRRVAVSAHSEERVSRRRVRSMRGHGTAETGWATKMAAHHLAPWALLSLYSRGHNKASDQDPRQLYAGTGKPQAGWQPSDMCQTPERAAA
jgi:hypothetical protein